MKDPKTQKHCEVPEAVVMKVTKWIRNADVERRAMPLPKVSPGASVLITASRVVAGTDQEKKRHQRDFMNIQNNRKLISKSKISWDAILFFLIFIFLAGENEYFFLL